MSLQQNSGAIPVGAVRPLQVGGTITYNQQTKPSAYANENVYASYGFPIYKTRPPCGNERSGNYSKVDERPTPPTITKEAIFPSDPEMNRLTDYFARRLPIENKSQNAILTMKQYGLSELLQRYLMKELQDDAEYVKSMYANATAPVAEEAMARLQNRSIEYRRNFHTNEGIRDAILRDIVGGQPDADLRQAVSNALAKEQASQDLPVDPTAPPGALPQDATETATGLEEADGEMIDDMYENEGDEAVDDEPVASLSQITRDLQRVRANKARLEFEIQSIEEDLESQDDAEQYRAKEAELLSLDNKLGDLTDRENELMRMINDMGGNPEQDFISTTAQEKLGRSTDDDILPPDTSYQADSGAYSVQPAIGGGAVVRENPLRGVPGSTKPLTGVLPGQESASIPYGSMSHYDPASSQSYRYRVKKSTGKDIRDPIGIETFVGEEEIKPSMDDMVSAVATDVKGSRAMARPEGVQTIGGKTRKTRSDKGKKRGPQRRTLGKKN